MNLDHVLREAAQLYPEELVQGQLRDIPRIAFNIRLALAGGEPQGLAICDLGGGVGLFTVGCAALGMQPVLVDDFGDRVNLQHGNSAFAAHRRFGVQIVSRDVVKEGIADLGPFDVVTSFDSMEHWHHSPKALFAQVRAKLKPGGRFVLGVPNCVNLRKRITIPFGVGKWSSIDEWYGADSFRGHVREPDVGDLRFIARDMDLREVKILGRNWQGYYSPRQWIRQATKVADVPLRAFPGLCADLYLTGRV